MNCSRTTIARALKTDLLIISGAFSFFLFFNFCSASLLRVRYDFMVSVFDLLPIEPVALPFFVALCDTISGLGKAYKKWSAAQRFMPPSKNGCCFFAIKRR